MQHIKPNLLDSVVSKEIVQKLNPPKEDYWKPTSNTFKNIYIKYIRTNLWFYVFLVLIIIFLIYRYFDIRNKNKLKMYQEKIQQMYGIDPPIKKTLYDDYKDVLLSAYYHQKEKSREPDLALTKPKIYRQSEKYESSPTYSDTQSDPYSSSKKPMAYPSFPQNDGRLTEPKKRKR